MVKRQALNGSAFNVLRIQGASPLDPYRDTEPVSLSHSLFNSSKDG